MTTVLIIVVGILVTGFLAYAIVNYIPRKLHWILSITLLLIAAFLVYKINFEITKPIKFNTEKKEKYAKVINNLKMIRDAEVAYKTVNGKYTTSGDDLITFIETGKYALTQTRYVPKTVKLGGGITKEIEERVVDTIGYEPVINAFKGRDYKGMMKIPGTEQNFKIEIGEIEKIEGLKAPVFEVKVDKALILAGMDENLIKQEKEAIGGDEIRGESVRVGSLSDVSEDGNWPPYYDKGDKKTKE